MALTIAGQSGSASYTDPSVGYMFSSGAYWESFAVGNIEYQYQDIEVPGRDGMDSKNHGARRRTMTASVVYVGASASAVHAAFIADRSSAESAPCTVTMPDSAGTYAAVYLDSMTPGHAPKATGHGTFWMGVDIVMTQKRFS